MAAKSWASPALIALVGVALAAGAGAALLAGTTPSASPDPEPGSFFQLPAQVWGLLFVAPLALGFVAILVDRLRSPGVVPLGRSVVFFATLLVVGIVFLLLVHFAVSGGCLCTPSGSFGTGGTAPGNNSTNTSQGNPGNGSGSMGPAGVLTVASDLPYFVIVAVALGVAAVAIPSVLGRPSRGRGGAGLAAEDTSATHDALAAAVSELDEGQDPRAVIVHLYDRLLRRVGPLVGEVAYSTAEEIRRTFLLPLGVRKGAADTLTRLFEEARYSSHPLSAASAAEARDAIRAAEADLARPGTGP